MVKDMITIDNAQIRQRNFTGRGGTYNREGDRNFLLMLDNQDLANDLIKDGWNVKIKEPYEEGDEPSCFMNVKVKFNKDNPGLDPVIWLRTGKNMNRLSEETVNMLDDIEIESVDLDIRPYNWDVNGKQGVSAYLNSICVTQRLDRHMLRYAAENPEE